MNFWNVWKTPALLAFVAGLSLLAGCATMDEGGGRQAASNAEPPAAGATEGSDFLRPGQKITIEFTDVQKTDPITQAIREDGLINLPLGVEVKAAGKNRSELIKEIHDAYVPKYYRRLSVNVKIEDLYYTVGGEVKLPSQRPYLGETTVLQAIQSAGDFTDFANKKRIDVTRSNGKTIHVNGYKAMEDRSKDIPIYPGDRIIVHRRII